MISFTVSGAEELAKRLRAIQSSLQGPALDAAALAGAMPIVNHAKAKAPVLTGNLRRSIHAEKIGTGRAAVGTNVIYARQREFGGTIVPRNAKTLAFRIDGRMVFAKRVYQRPRPFMRPAMDEKRNDALRDAKLALADALRKAGA